MKKNNLKVVVALGLGLMGLVSLQAQQFVWNTFSGNPAGGSGFMDGVGNGARFSYPNSVAVDASGFVYVADTGNNTIRKLVYSGTTCTVSTLAGTPGVTGTVDGISGAAQFNNPSGIAVDAAGNLYVADTGNFTIRKINVSSGQVTTLAGSPGQMGAVDGPGALFGSPIGIAVDVNGNVYVADSSNYTIRMITAGGVVSTLAGSPGNRGCVDGTGSRASFDTTGGLAVDGSGNLFVADTSNNTIRKVTPSGVVTTFAGSPGVWGSFDGTGMGATFNLPGSVAVDGAGNVYVADTYNNTLRKITVGGVVSTLAGTVCTMGHSDGVGAAATFNFPGGIAVTGNGTVYVADTCNHTIRKEIWQVVTTVAGSAPDFGTNNGLRQGYSLALDSSALNGATGLAVDDNGTVYIADTQNQLILQRSGSGATTVAAGLVASIGNNDGVNVWPLWAEFDFPEGIAVDSGTNLYVTDTFNNSVRKVSLLSGTWTTTTICGSFATKGNLDGSGSNAMFNNPIGIAVDSGTNLYVADTYNSTIRQLTCSGTIWTATTIAGSPSVNGTSDGTGSAALFAYPYGIAVDSGTNLYVVDSGNYTIRMLTLSGSTWTSQTIAGTPGVTGTADGVGAAAQFGYPTMVAVDKVGHLFVADTGNSTIRMLTNTGSNWLVSTIGGISGVNGGVSGGVNDAVSEYEGIGTQALFSAPRGISVKTSPTGTDQIYVMDSGNNRVMVGSYSGNGNVSQVTGTSATLSAVVNPNGLSTSVYFQYGGHTLNWFTYGLTTGTQTISGTNFVTVTAMITGLAANQSYDYREVVVNSSGTFYGTTQVWSESSSAVPSMTSATTITGTNGDPLTYTIVATNAATSFGASSLPAGLVLNPVTGVISGIPTVTASTAVFLSATNAVGTGTATLTFNIVNRPLPVFINTSGTVSGIAGSYFYGKVTASNDITSYSASGLPTGVILNAASGVFSGVPTTVGTFSGTLGAINSTGTVTMPLTIIVTPPYTWNNFAGNPSSITGTADGTGTTARFYYPKGVAVDSGSNIYVADTYNCTIRKITPSGAVSTLAGSPRISGSMDGTGTNAKFYYPQGIAVDSGSNVYVADTYNFTIRKITPSGDVSTLAGSPRISGSMDGTGTNAKFYYPEGIAVDSGSNVYVVDTNNFTIRKITLSGSVSTLAGTPGLSGTTDGTGAAARFYYPMGIAVDSGSNVYVADIDNNTIRKVTPAGVVTTIAGTPGTIGTTDGLGTGALFNGPMSIAIDSGTNLYITDGAYTIRKMTLSGTIWMVTTIGGTAGISGTADGVGSGARFSNSYGVSVDSSGLLYVMDTFNNRISAGSFLTQTPVITSALSVSGTVGGLVSYTITASNGGTNFVASGLPPGLILNGNTGLITGTISASGTSGVLLSASNALGTGVTTTVTFSLVNPPPPLIISPSVASGGAGNTFSYTIASTNYPTGFSAIGLPPGLILNGSTGVISGVLPTIGSYGVTISATNVSGTTSTALMITIGDPYVWSNFVGNPGVTGSTNGTGTNALFFNPFGVAIDSGSNIYLAEAGNDTIRKISVSGAVSTLAGNPGVTGSVNGLGAAALFNNPAGVAVDSGSNVYVADTVNNTIRKIMVSGSVSTFAGNPGFTGTTDATGTAALFNHPSGGAVDSGSNVYVADTNNNTIRKITVSGSVSTLAGTPSIAGTSDGLGSAARFNHPQSIAVDSGSNVYVVDTLNNTVRMITPAGLVSTLAGTSGVTGFTDGPGTVALFFQPCGVAVDSGTNLYVTDGNSTIRKMTLVSGTWMVTTIGGTPNVMGIADGGGSAAQFYYPKNIAVNSDGSLWVADAFNQRISKGVPMQYPVITSATTITGTTNVPFNYTLAANLNSAITGYWVSALPPGLSLNAATGVISGTPTATGTMSVILSATNVMGTGTANATIGIVSLPLPVFTSAGGALGVAGSLFSYTVTAINTVTSFTASGLPPGLTLNPSTGLISGTLSVAGNYSVTLGAINVGGTTTTALNLTVPPNYVWSNFSGTPTVTGTANGLSALFNSPNGVAVDSGSNVYVADTTNQTIRMISPSGSVSLLAGTPGTHGATNGQGSSAQFYTPYGIAVDSGSNVYVADTSNNTIRMITPSGLVSTLAGTAGTHGTTNGTGTSALFYYPYALALDSGSNVYVADTYSNTIRKISVSGSVSTLAGTPGTSGTVDGPGTSAMFYRPEGVAVDSSSNVYIADTFNNTIREITSGGTVITLAGTPGAFGTGSADGVGSVARFNRPMSIAVDSGTNLYIGDHSNQTIRKMILVNGIWNVTTIGGSALLTGTVGGQGSVARFNGPAGIALSSNGNLFVADATNDRISVGSLSIPVITSGLSMSGTNGVGISYSITASNTPAGYYATGLPSWLSLNTTTGVITGTPTTSGTFVASIGAGNQSGLGTATWTLIVPPIGTAYQSWQSLVFTSPQLSLPTISGDTATPMGDGISNLMKYALGMNPNVSYSGASAQMPQAGVSTVGPNQYLTLTFTGTASDVIYSVQVISDLTGAWTTLYSSVLGTAPGTVTVSDTVPITSSTKRFMRLQVSH